MKNQAWIYGLFLFLGMGCGGEDAPEASNASIRFQFQFDETQERLDNVGKPVLVPSGNGAQSPTFNSMSGYYIELVPTQTTQFGDGAVIYTAKTQASQAGSSFDEAVVFDEAIVASEGEEFLALPIKDIPAGTYEYLRISVTYQNTDVKFDLINMPSPLPSSLTDQTGTLAGFIGFNSYLTSHQVKNKTLAVNADKQQGFWIFEPQLTSSFQSLYLNVNPSGLISGQAPANATTVVNPLASFGVTLPQGTCVVTGKLDKPLVITGNESEDISLTLSFSVNNSFEWKDDNGNGKWDIDVGNASSEQVVDMGLRGLKVITD